MENEIKDFCEMQKYADADRASLRRMSNAAWDICMRHITGIKWEVGEFAEFYDDITELDKAQPFYYLPALSRSTGV
jgi:hypothetical protein